MNSFDLEFHEPASDLVLAAGVEADLPAIREWLAELPESVYGQVIIESDEELPRLETPAGVGVTRVTHFFEPGMALAMAVDAWFDEWVWAEADSPRTLQFWTRSGEAPAFGACRRRMQRLLGRREPSVAQTVDLAD